MAVVFMGSVGCDAGVAFDTNMLMAITQFKVDVLDCVEGLLGKMRLVVPKQVVVELNDIGKGGGKDGKAAEMALGIAESAGLEVLDTEGSDADNALLELSGQGFKIATNDSDLRKEVKKRAGCVLYLRKKKFLEIG